MRSNFFKFDNSYNPISIQKLHIPHWKERWYWKVQWNVRKINFNVQIQTQETIIYHRHKSKSTEFIPRKKLMVEVEGKKLMGKLNLSLTLIPSFCTFLILSSHFTPTTIEWCPFDNGFIIFFLVLLLVKEICFPHSIHIRGVARNFLGGWQFFY